MTDKPNITRALVVQEGKTINNTVRNFMWLLAAISIYSMFLPALFIDIFLVQYQNIYFKIAGIPKLKRSDYIVLDRYNLKGLNLIQKINCVYCGYVNGLVAFAKDVANQTEIYSCAIKHNSRRKGQEHQENFYEYSTFN